MSGHVPKSPVQPGPGSCLKGEVGERERWRGGMMEKWRRRKSLGGDASQSLRVTGVWVNTLSDSH